MSPTASCGWAAGCGTYNLVYNSFNSAYHVNPHLVASVIKRLPTLQQLLAHANALAAKAVRAVRNEILNVIDASLFGIIFGSLGGPPSLVSHGIRNIQAITHWAASSPSHAPRIIPLPLKGATLRWQRKSPWNGVTTITWQNRKCGRAVAFVPTRSCWMQNNRQQFNTGFVCANRGPSRCLPASDFLTPDQGKSAAILVLTTVLSEGIGALLEGIAGAEALSAADALNAGRGVDQAIIAGERAGITGGSAAGDIGNATRTAAGATAARAAAGAQDLANSGDGVAAAAAGQSAQAAARYAAPEDAGAGGAAGSQVSNVVRMAGRRGSAVVRDQLDQVRDELLNANPDWVHVAGGRVAGTGAKLPEQAVYNPANPLQRRFPDLTFGLPDGSPFYVNTVDTYASGAATIRELEAAVDIKLWGGGPVLMIPKP